MKRLERTKKHLKYIFSLATAAILLLSVLIVNSIEFVLDYFNVFSRETEQSWWYVAGVYAVACALIGASLSLLANKLILRPYNNLLDGMEKLAGGKYDARMSRGRINALKPMADSFNELAEELDNTEILRTNFVNNFSHEFKTPIMSIKGLISLMKSGKVSREKEREYLLIIEEEIDRLSMMTTNILSLSKIENQSILIDRCEYNLSEQIRTCVLLEEKKWREKALQLSLDFDEYKIVATEDLLKQVWINLIDNAIKFSSRGGYLEITVSDLGEELEVSVSNSGAPISEEELSKIWNKFYQIDRVHSKSGNGIGLSIVKSIVELHSGSVRARSKEGKNTFTVTLPKIVE